LAQVGQAADRYEETMGEYAAGAARRFANLAPSEDWLSLMNVIERANDPGIDCLTYMVRWSLKQEDAPPTLARQGCTCGGNGGCS
jgi:coenzyme F420-reducing hydrogenase alpha subunit